MKRDRPYRAYVVGLTGNIATGKSSVARLLRQFGAQVIDADQVAHEGMQQGTPTHRRILERFGPSVRLADGEINRQELGRIVFADPAALRDLERIVHPAVIEEVDRRIAGLAAESAEPPIVVVEAIKLVEAGMHERYDALWVVTCEPEQQLARLKARSGLSEQEARLRLDAQPPEEAKLAMADVVIDNSGTWAKTARQVRAAWRAVLVAALDKKG